MKKTSTKIFFVSLLIFGSVSFWWHNLVTQQTEIENAVVLLKNGDYESAIVRLTVLANKGNGSAKYILGITYAFGNGVPADAERAAELLRGNTPTSTADYFESIADAYSSGEGVKQDPMQAEKWRQLAMQERKK